MATTFAEFYALYDEATRAGADEAIRVGIAKMVELTPFALIPAIVVSALLVGTGQMGWRLFTSYGFRIVILVWLTVGAAYTPYIRNFVVDDVPNEIATALHGSIDNRITAAQQFDLLEEASGHYTALVLSQATGIMQLGNRISIWQARGWTKLFIELIFYIWVAIRMLLYLTVAMGSFLLLFIIFESTRGWVMSFFGKLVALSVWQLCTSILLKIMLAGSQVFLRGIINNGASMSIEQQADVCWNILGWFVGCFVLMIMIPTATAIGSNSAASSAIAGGAMWNAGASMARAGNAMSRASHRMAQAARRATTSTSRGP